MVSTVYDPSIVYEPWLICVLLASIGTLLITSFHIVVPLLGGSPLPGKRATAVVTLVVNAVTMVFWLTVFAWEEEHGSAAAGLIGSMQGFAVLLVSCIPKRYNFLGAALADLHSGLYSLCYSRSTVSPHLGF